MEICIDSLESARNAIFSGASRLEVCSALSEGGLTPTPGFVKTIRSFSSIPIYIMIRIRPGDFVYSSEEMDVMLYDLQILKKLDVNGFVFGALTLDAEIDVDACKKVLAAARPLPVTFHRAFDEIRWPFKALETIVGLGFERILTSGQKDTAEEGLEIIKQLVDEADGRIVIMPGSGITKDNISKIQTSSGAKEFHASAKKKKSTYKSTVRIGSVTNDYIMITDGASVKQMVDIINS